jgi:hypothetical protein
MSTRFIPLPALVSALARATEESASSRADLCGSDLTSVPRILAGMGRAMSPEREGAWLAAVETCDVLAIRRLAVALAARRPGTPPGPHVPLLSAIVCKTGQALSLRDVGDHYAERGALPCRAASLAGSAS